jgi:uncharacterized protein YlaI
MAFDFYVIYTDNIRSIQNGLLDVVTAKKRDEAERVYLCSECHSGLWKCNNYKISKSDDWSCYWPSFFGIC